MLKEALEYLIQVTRPSPITHKVDGREYAISATKEGLELGNLVTPPTKPTLALCSLSGFVDAFKSGIDAFGGAKAKAAVQVVNHATVALVSLEADEYGRRHEWVRATCGESNPFPFNTYQTPEMFLINLQSGFLPTDNIVSLQRLASSLTTENSIGVQDDGLAQTVTVKQGSVTRDAITLPPRIGLFAYRTFREIDPVESPFMVRLKGKPGELPTIALLEIDAGKWKHDTMLMIAKYLKNALPEAKVIA